MPVYRIDLPGSELPRAVEADTPAQAVQYVVRDSVTVRRLDVSEAFALAVEGVALERAGETAPAAGPEPDGDDADGGQLDPGALDQLKQPEESYTGRTPEPDADDGDGDGEFDEDDATVRDGATGELVEGGEPAFYGEGQQS